MASFLYNADDAPFIHHILGFFTHIQACEDCMKRASDEEGAPQIAYLFDALNQIALRPIEAGDFAGACQFCEGWFQIHTIMTLIDLDPDGGAGGTVQ